jgi:hypothetical protein
VTKQPTQADSEIHEDQLLNIEWGTKIKQELSEGWSREIEHDLTTEYGEHEWTVDTVVRD